MVCGEHTLQRLKPVQNFYRKDEILTARMPSLLANLNPTLPWTTPWHSSAICALRQFAHAYDAFERNGRRY